MSFLTSNQRMGLAAAILAASAFLSRIMGLIRDKIISWQFGATHEADMYFAAFVVPDIINYLLAGGFMSITIIPLLARSFETDAEDAWSFFSCVLFWIFASSFTLTILGEIFASHLAHITAPGFTGEQLDRLAFFMRIILPGQIFFLTGSCFTALLFLRRQFAAPALSPLIYNGFIILFGVTLPHLPGLGSDFGMTGYCMGVSFGAFFGALALPYAIALKNGIKFKLALWHPQLKKFFIIALPLMLGQTVVMLDEQFLRVFGSMIGEGSVSLLNYARRIAQLPVSLLGQAIAVASYPFLVQLLAQNKTEEFNRTLNRAFSTGLAFIIPLSLVMIATAGPILGIIFEGGRFGASETAACAPLARIMLLIAPAWVIYMVLARAFYAIEDTLTPALTGTIITALAIPCYYALAVPLGEWAIAACSAISICLYLIWLIHIWIRRKGPGPFQGLGTLAIRALGATLVPAMAAAAICDWIPADLIAQTPFLGHCLRLMAGLAVFALVFIPLAHFICPAILTRLTEIALAKIKRARLLPNR